MPRHGSSSRSHLSWLEPDSADALSPMQLLVIWLSRHYAKYSISNTKGEMIQELCQGMRDAGYPDCTVHAIRSKIDSLRREARKTGDHRHSRAFQQYQQPLATIFATEGSNAAANSGNPSNKDQAKMELTVQSRPATHIANEGKFAVRFHRALPSNSELDVTEIRRRFELLCARHALEEEGVAVEIINKMLPLP